MARPNWEYIRVDVLLPEHPKVEGLSDKAFRALITLWCYCGRQRTDGAVTRKQWEAWPPRVRAELIAAGLASPIPAGGRRRHARLPRTPAVPGGNRRAGRQAEQGGEDRSRREMERERCQTAYQNAYQNA